VTLHKQRNAMKCENEEKISDCEEACDSMKPVSFSIYSLWYDSEKWNIQRGWLKALTVETYRLCYRERALTEALAIHHFHCLLRETSPFLLFSISCASSLTYWLFIACITLCGLLLLEAAFCSTDLTSALYEANLYYPSIEGYHSPPPTTFSLFCTCLFLQKYVEKPVSEEKAAEKAILTAL